MKVDWFAIVVLGLGVPTAVGLALIFKIPPDHEEGPGIIIFRSGQDTGFCERIVKHAESDAGYTQIVCHQTDGVTAYALHEVSTIKRIGR